MLRFDNLAKHYDQRVIFTGLQYTANAGCLAINDESGSGKSTLLGILAGAIDADAGEVWIGEHSMRTEFARAKSLLSYIPDDCMPNPLLTGHAYLASVASDRRTTVDARTLDMAHRFGLEAHLEKRFEQMSFGTRKKIFLTASLMGESSVVIADEPAAGLDAPARVVLIDLFRTLAKSHAVFFSSYDLALIQACEAQTICFADLARKPGH